MNAFTAATFINYRECPTLYTPKHKAFALTIGSCTNSRADDHFDEQGWNASWPGLKLRMPTRLNFCG